LANREILRARRQQHQHQTERYNSYSIERNIPHWSIPISRDDRHQYYGDQQMLKPSNVEGPKDHQIDHRGYVDRRAGGPPCGSQFWFEDTNGTLIGGKRKINHPSGDLGAPKQVKRVRFSLDNDDDEDADAPGQSSSGGNQAPLPRMAPASSDGHQEVSEFELKEYRRRKGIVNHLAKICKAVPLTVKMADPLIHFDGWPN